jgi:hypothetical protein
MHFKRDRDVGISVCAPKGTTLKMVVQNKIQARCNSFYYYISGTFGSLHLRTRARARAHAHTHICICSPLSRLESLTSHNPTGLHGDSFTYFIFMFVCVKSRGGVVGISTAYGLAEVRVPLGSRIFTSPYPPDQL